MYQRLTDAQTLLAFALANPDVTPKIRDDLLTTADEKSVLQSIRERWRTGNDTSLQSIAEVSSMSATQLAALWEESRHITLARFNEVLARISEQYRQEVLREIVIELSTEMIDGKLLPSETIGALSEHYHAVGGSQLDHELRQVDSLVEDWKTHYTTPASNRLMTGITGIDEAVGGLRGTELVLVMADTGMGKTNLLLNIAMNMCASGKSVLFYSLEMGANELLDRLIPIVGNVDARAVRERTISMAQLQPILDRLKSLNFRVVDSGQVTSQQIVDDIVNQRHRGTVDVVMVDYLQRLSDGRGEKSEVERLGNIARLLKNTALTYRVPIFTPVQVDKSSSKGGTIRVENVAWSKDIANEADLALYLYQEEVGGESLANLSLPPKTYVKIVKSRHSERGQRIELLFSSQTLRMQDMLGRDKKLLH